jgi:hypothetical protein
VLLVVEIASVEFPEVLIDPALKLADIPAGNPLAPSETVPVKLFSAPTLTVRFVPLPACTVCVEGVAASEKSGFCVVVSPTTRLMFALWLTGPLAPHKVTGYVPDAALLAAVTVIVGSPDPFTAVALRIAVTPAGAPVTANCTVPEKPPCAATLAFAVELPPLATVTVVGLTLTEKSEPVVCVDFWVLLKPMQPVKHNIKPAAAKLVTNLGEIIGPRLRARRH